MAIPSDPFLSHCSLITSQFPALLEGKRKPWDPQHPSKEPGFQKAFSALSLRDPVRLALVEEAMKQQAFNEKKPFPVTIQARQILATPLNLATHYSDLIDHHLTLRVALFFQQTIVCYKTPFHYRIAATEGQVFSAKTLAIKAGNEKEHKISYQAAHSSTIPGLDACLRSEVNAAHPGYFSFLKGSHLDLLNNSTVSLPDFVNKMDTLIDGKASNGFLRSQTINLLNEVARGEKTPVQATREFIDNLIYQLQTRPQQSKSMTPEKHAAITQYLLYAHELRAQVVVNEQHNQPCPFFDSLIDFDVRGENPQDLSHLRDIVYKQKYSIIREARLTDSKVMQKIDEYFPQDTSHDEKHFIKLCLTYHCRNDAQKRVYLSKLFAISVTDIERNPALCQSLQQHYLVNKAKYDNLLRDIRLLVTNYQKLEQCFQAQLLQRFRTELRDLTQKELSDKVKRVVATALRQERAQPEPDQTRIAELQKLPSSPSTISRLENSRIHIIKPFKTTDDQRRKKLTLTQAEVVAKALDVQAGHFFCSLYLS
jgi:hypothetical protein